MDSAKSKQPSPLRQLLSLLTENVERLECIAAAAAAPIPDLHTPFSLESEAFRAIPEAAEAARIVSAAALHLDAILAPPQISIFRVVDGHFKSAALRICLESGVTEILREAGPEGLSTSEIAAKNGQDADKLARFLRYLATHHVYREVSPNVFANTRLSSMLDTGKSSEEILKSPDTKYEATSGLAAVAAHHLDEVFKASANAWETLCDGDPAEGDPSLSPFARAMKLERGETMWAYFAKPEVQTKARRFDIAMQGILGFQPPNAIVNSYDWAALPQGAVVVDVGGGVGTTCFALAERFPNLKLVLQDQEAVLGHAKKMWEERMPDALTSGRVQLQLHNFFSEQPQISASVFVIKHASLDWADKYAKEIFSRLWDAATPDTTLLVLDIVMPLACRENAETSTTSHIPGAALPEAPEPLLPNYGGANDMAYNVDFAMFLLTNSQTRTAAHFMGLLASVGWKVVRIHGQGGDSAYIKSVEAKKVANLN
ncbi:S-adenosyl-L-methionine-dependent methyltransferase [Mycena indigotica]|uniref:S-adenosyl-L-methionine-dependent methyltransferase n=1 Tax=Mycena indigotica TaxID=2126181 RepID=A0A8H6T7S8_9AGAR|nr:S-adenosyl-L-methionine-dependent methyltransferase [Mycena indigotica]KAF7311917.1 S-adenosyl-L-methionine-dependent methyltransferase [Mycena indigotica]